MALPVASIYCRVSSDGQGDNYSLGTQEAECREYATAQGYTVDERYVFREIHSGLDYFDRPKLMTLMQAVEARDVDVGIAHDDDRLSRHPTHKLMISEVAKYHGVLVRYRLREIDDTPEGELISYVRGMGYR